MFDRYTREGDTHVNVKQLPHDTADAARLHGEIEERARARMANAAIYALGANNELKVIKVAPAYSCANDQHLIRVVFDLNGTQHDFEVRPDDVSRRAYAEIAALVFDAVVRTLEKKEPRDG